MLAYRALTSYIKLAKRPNRVYSVLLHSNLLGPTARQYAKILSLSAPMYL